MSEIPDDIINAARDALIKTSGLDHHTRVMEVALAILAERERAATRIEQLEAEIARLQSCVWRADYLAIAAQKLVDVERTHAGCSGIQLAKLSDELALYWKHAGGTPSARAALAGKAGT